jgi:glycosyltransferase involved in cell wall biosynthesis
MTAGYDTPMTLRVALVYLGRRGAGPVLALELAKALKDRAYVQLYLSTSIENKREVLHSGLNVAFVNTYGSILGAVFNTTLLPIRLWPLFHGLWQFQPNVVHYPMLHPWVPLINVVLDAILPRVSKVLTIHDAVRHPGEESRVLTLLQEIAVRQSDRIITHSQYVNDLVVARGVSASKVDAIPHGHYGYYIGEKCPPIGNAILFFGRIKEYKGIEILLEALGYVRQVLPEVPFILAGKGDLAPYNSRVKELSGVQMINRWIPDTEVGTIIERAAVVVLPYLEASQSGVIPLAFAAGRPVIATRVGAIEEQVQDGVNGILVPPKDARALADAIIHLLSNREKLMWMGTMAKATAACELNWDRIAELTVKSYERTLSEDRKR